MDWMTLAKSQKETWVATTKRGDMPPTVIAERNGKPIIVLVAPQIDKYLGLQAAKMCRVGFCADAITLICDSHTINTKGKTKEQIEALHNKYAGKPGSMQKACDDEDACAHGEIIDVINAVHIDSKGMCSFSIAPYYYHGEDGPPFRWDEDDHWKNVTMVEDGDKVRLEGLIPDNLRAIMKEKTIMDAPEVRDVIGTVFSDISYDRAIELAGVSMRRVAHDHNFLLLEVVDLSECKTPEEINKVMRHKMELCQRAYNLDEMKHKFTFDDLMKHAHAEQAKQHKGK